MSNEIDWDDLKLAARNLKELEEAKRKTAAIIERLQRMILGNELEDGDFLGSLDIIDRSPNMGDVIRVERKIWGTDE